MNTARYDFLEVMRASDDAMEGRMQPSLGVLALSLGTLSVGLIGFAFVMGMVWARADYQICFEDGSCKVFTSAQEIRNWYGN